MTAVARKAPLYAPFAHLNLTPSASRDQEKLSSAPRRNESFVWDLLPQLSSVPHLKALSHCVDVRERLWFVVSAESPGVFGAN